MSKIATCLWFDGQAEQAASFYVSVFNACGREARIGRVSRYGEQAPQPKGSVMVVEFTLAGQEFIALNGGPHFTLSPAVSIFVTCADQAEIDDFWDRLTEDGGPSQCGWLTDRFGMSWQIVPAALGDMLHDPEPERSARVMQALMRMTKLDLAALCDAHQGRVATPD